MGKRKEAPLMKLGQIQYQKSIAEGTTKREAKKLARLVSIGKKVPFSNRNSDSSMNTQNIKVELRKLVMR